MIFQNSKHELEVFFFITVTLDLEVYHVALSCFYYHPFFPLKSKQNTMWLNKVLSGLGLCITSLFYSAIPVNAT